MGATLLIAWFGYGFVCSGGSILLSGLLKLVGSIVFLSWLVFVPVPMPDVPVPQTVDQLMEVLKILDISSPVEQVTDVPEISSQDNIPQRAVLRVPQLVEQFGGRAGGVPGALRPQCRRAAGDGGYWHGSATLPAKRGPRSRGRRGLLVDGCRAAQVPVDPGRYTNTGQG